MTILVVSAWEPELAPLRALLASCPLEGITTRALGVGVIEAALAMPALLAARPRLTLFLGTCGAYPGPAPAFAVGDVVVARQVRLGDWALQQGAAQWPGAAPDVETADEDAAKALEAAGARPVRVLNTLGITVSDAAAVAFGKTSDVEHLETFAVARACAASGVAWGSVLGVANPVGSRGRAIFRAQHAAASQAAAAVLHRALVSISEREEKGAGG